MSYSIKRVVLYFGKYTNGQRRADQSEYWCQISFEAIQGFNVPEKFKRAGFILKPGKKCTYRQWLNDDSAMSMLKFCRQPQSIAEKISDLCHDDRLAYKVPVNKLHEEPAETDHIGLIELKFFTFTVESSEYGFTTEEHIFDREYELVDDNGDRVKDADGNPIRDTSVSFFYFTNHSDYGRDSQLAAELKHWRVRETPQEMMSKVTSMAQLSINK